MNNKNVYSLNNTFEGKIWVDWKGKDGKMGQEISWREKHFYSAEIPTHWHLCEVYLTVPVPVPVPACTRVKDYGRVPCAVSQISGCGRPQIIHTSMEIAAFSGMSTRVCILRALFMSTENIGSDIGRCSKKTSAIGSAGKTDIGWSLSAMYNQSQGNTQYTLLEHKWNTKCTEPVTSKTPRVHERRMNKKQEQIKAI